MRALVKTAPGVGHLELRDWPEPHPRPGEVKMRVAAAGICGTDIHILNGTWTCQPPVVLGHEWCGTITETGARVRSLQPGDRVVASNPAQTCGLCFYCQAGNPFMCPERVSAGYMIDGAFADYLCIDEKRCHKLPDHVTFREAALGEPLAVAVHAAMERTTVHSGDVVFVSGPGCIGLLTAQIARLEGAFVLVAGVGKDEKRLECARRTGADVVLNTEKDDVAGTIAEFTSGRGADLVYECSGSAASLATCWKVVRKGGVLASLGVHPGPIHTDFNSVMMKELTVVGSYGYLWTSWQRAVQFLRHKKIQADAMISHEFALEDFEEAFRATQGGDGIKVIMNMNRVPVNGC